MSDEKIESALASLGFTRYESEVYNALVEIGEGSAREIANHCPVPREKIYYVLRRMERQGMVRLVSKNPIRYIALPPHITLKEKIDLLKRQVKKIEEAMEILEEKYNRGRVKIERKTLNFWEIFQSPEKTLKSFLKGAKERIDIIFSLEGSLRMTEELYHLLKKIGKEDVEINVYTPLRDVNIRPIGRLSNVANIRIIGEEILDSSIFIVDEEAGFIIDNEMKSGIHFIDARIASLFINFINLIEDSSKNFDSILTLLEQGDDPWLIMKRIGKAPFFDMLNRGVTELLIRWTERNRRNYIEELGNLILNMLAEDFDIYNLPLSEAIAKIVAIGAIVDGYNARVEFNEEGGILTYQLENDGDGIIESAVEKGVTYPPYLWSLLIQEVLKANGFVEAATTIIYDKYRNTWSFQKKFKPLSPAS